MPITCGDVVHTALVLKKQLTITCILIMEPSAFLGKVSPTLPELHYDWLVMSGLGKDNSTVEFRY